MYAHSRSTLPADGRKKSPGWQKDAKSWWYDLGDNGYLTDTPVYINGETYGFDEQGYMRTGWYSPNNDAWYFFNGEGSMKKNAWEGNYWLAQDGLMARNQ